MKRISQAIFDDPFEQQTLELVWQSISVSFPEHDGRRPVERGAGGDPARPLKALIAGGPVTGEQLLAARRVLNRQLVMCEAQAVPRFWCNIIRAVPEEPEPTLAGAPSSSEDRVPGRKPRARGGVALIADVEGAREMLAGTRAAQARDARRALEIVDQALGLLDIDPLADEDPAAES